jgi:L-iditol 2-dehydrogenase
MGENMRAVFIHAARDLRLGTLPRPTPQEGELLLAVRAVGICGSDLHYYLEGGIGEARIAAPLVLGHEFAARVADESGLAWNLPPGTLVAVDPARPCGRCEWCRAGHPNLCPGVRFAGSPPDQHGALTEYVVAPPEALFPVPPTFSPSTAALLEPLGVAIHALDLARLRSMDTVAVLGAGPIGLLLVQVARLGGAGRIIAVDPIEARIDLARRLGADQAAPHHQAVLDWTAGRGADLVLEATDSSQAPAQAAQIARIGGKVVLAGIPRDDWFSLNASVARRKGLTIKMVRRMGHVYPRAIQMVASGRVQLEPLVTHRFPLAQTPQAFALQAARADRAVKSVIEL